MKIETVRLKTLYQILKNTDVLNILKMILMQPSMKTMRRRRNSLNLTFNSKELQAQAHLSIRPVQFFKCLTNKHRNENQMISNREMSTKNVYLCLLRGDGGTDRDEFQDANGTLVRIMTWAMKNEELW